MSEANCGIPCFEAGDPGIRFAVLIRGKCPYFFNLTNLKAEAVQPGVNK